MIVRPSPRLRFFFLVLLWSVTTWCAALEVRPFEAEYEVKFIKLLLGQVAVFLEVDEQGAYRYGSTTTTTGALKVFRDDVITEISRGRISGDRVIPETYTYTHKSSDRDRRITVNFDWEAGTVTNHAKDSHWRMEVPTGTQDKASKQLALMLSLSPQSPKVAFQVADGGRLKLYRYALVETLKMSTIKGEQTIHRVARSKGDSPSRTSIWLAPGLHNLPVEAEKEDDDRIFSMNLTRLKWTGDPIRLPDPAAAPP